MMGSYSGDMSGFSFRRDRLVAVASTAGLAIGAIKSVSMMDPFQNPSASATEEGGVVRTCHAGYPSIRQLVYQRP